MRFTIIRAIKLSVLVRLMGELRMIMCVMASSASLDLRLSIKDKTALVILTGMMGLNLTEVIEACIQQVLNDYYQKGVSWFSTKKGVTIKINGSVFR